MINLKLLYKIIGSLLFIETTMFLVCLGVAIGYELSLIHILTLPTNREV